jgi:hypothetical protein
MVQAEVGHGGNLVKCADVASLSACHPLPRIDAETEHLLGPPLGILEAFNPIPPTSSLQQCFLDQFRGRLQLPHRTNAWPNSRPQVRVEKASNATVSTSSGESHSMVRSSPRRYRNPKVPGVPCCQTTCAGVPNRSGFVCQSWSARESSTQLGRMSSVSPDISSMAWRYIVVRMVWSVGPAFAASEWAISVAAGSSSSRGRAWFTMPASRASAPP